MLNRIFVTLSTIVINFNPVQGEVGLITSCDIDGSKPLQHVSEKFLSLTIDPMELMAGIKNLSDTSLLLAKHLSPAYIRIAGPSTEFVKYVGNDNHLSEGENSVTVTSSMWYGINEWLKLANLTPVFGINDAETTEGVWDPKSTLPLLEISDRLNVSCYWMLGFDPSQKTAKRYEEDLNIFHHTLAAFTKRNDSWKIVGSDMSKIQSGNETMLDDLRDVITAAMWEPVADEEGFPEKQSNVNILQSKNRANIEIWTTAPKSSTPVTFSSALLWADQVGKAAKMGYDVVFRQPGSEEIFSETPIYWFSLLHKKLMGEYVLEVKQSTPYLGSSVYAHCSKQSSDIREMGSITLMIVNKNLQSSTIKVKLAGRSVNKTMDSYILNSLNANSREVFLNGQKLTSKLLLETNPFQPQQDVVKYKTHLPLIVPPMSISFFVLPNTEIQACTDKPEINSILEDSRPKEEVRSDEISATLQSRGLFDDIPVFNQLKKNIRSNRDVLKQNSHTGSVEEQLLPSKINYFDDNTKQEHSQHMKHIKKRQSLKHLLEEIKPYDSMGGGDDNKFKSKLIYVRSAEVDRFLKEKARARALQRNVILSEPEIDMLVEAARRRFLKNEYINSHEVNYEPLEKPMLSARMKNSSPIRKRRDVNMKLLGVRSKLEEARQLLEERKSEVVGNAHTLKQTIKDRIKKIKNNYRFKRDINMELLKLKTEGQNRRATTEATRKRLKTLFKDKEEKEATIRKPGQTSDELIEETEEESESAEQLFPKGDVFAELADSQESEEYSSELPKSNTKPKKTSILDKIFKSNHIPSKSLKTNKSKTDPKKEDSLKFLTASDEVLDIQDDLPCIHEYFGTNNKKRKQNNENRKMTGSKTADSMEYFRKKRSKLGNGNTILELGEVDYNCGDIPKGNIDNTKDVPDDTEENEADKILENQEFIPAMKNVESFENRAVPMHFYGPEKIQKLSLEERQSNSDEFDENYDFYKSAKTNSATPTNEFIRTLRKRDVVDKNEDEIKTENKTDKYNLTKNKLRGILLKVVEKDKNKSDKQMESGILSDDQKKTSHSSENTNELREKLVLMKHKITQRLKELHDDFKQKESSETKKENLGETLKLGTQTEKSNLETSDNPPQLDSNAALHGNNKNLLSHSVTKRSVLDPVNDVFGNYKPVTLDIKNWKPSDILSLKREVNFHSPTKLKPMNDIRMYRSRIPDKFVSRRKRQTSDNYKSDEDHLNNIEKDDSYTEPKINKGQDVYKYGISGKHTAAVGGTSENIQKIAKKQHSSTENFVTPATTPTAVNRFSDNIQKIPTVKQQHAIDSFMSDVSEFIRYMGKALSRYLQS